MAKLYYPPAPTERPHHSPFRLLFWSLLINLGAALGLWLISFLSIPYLPSFLWGTVEVARLAATGAPATPHTELGRWYARYQEAQDGALDKLNAVSDPLPLDHLAASALFRQEDERLSLRPQLDEYSGGLHTWDQESHEALSSALAELDSLQIPPGSAAWVRAVVEPYETEWINRQSTWAVAESGWVTQVIDLYNYVEISERRGALRLDGEKLHFVNPRDQQGYEERLYRVAEERFRADGAEANLTDWTAAQTPLGLWQIFVNWVQGYGLTPPPAPPEPELLA